jgi:hypothetical protein
MSILRTQFQKDKCLSYLNMFALLKWTMEKKYGFGENSVAVTWPKSITQKMIFVLDSS